MDKITSPTNPLVKHLTKLRKNKAYRKECRTALIEGKAVVTELCAEQEPLVILTTDPAYAHMLPAQKCYLTSPEILKKVCGSVNPEGLIAEIPQSIQPFPKKLQRLLILDGVADPGNFGTLLRTALALHWEGIFLLPGCCDPFNDKALRAAKGATFHLPIKEGDWKILSPLLQQHTLHPFAAELEGTLLENFSTEQGIALLLGNEAQGVSKESKNRCQAVTIPIAQEMESLNVSAAGAILMYALRAR